MRKLVSLVAVVALGMSALAACGNENDEFGRAGVKVEGAYGAKPTVTHREGEPDKSLVTEVLKDGDGAEVKKGQLLVAHYLGQIWRDNKVFDNSYDRKAPASFPIGVGRVVTGWDEGLVGKKVGSRVLLSIPPDKGYKEQGNKEAGIEGTDTLIFVVDIVGAFDLTAKAAGGATQAIPAGNPQVSGPITAEPKVKIPSGVKAPAKPGAPIVLIKGTGKPLEKNSMLLMHYAIFDYKGAKKASTWVASAQSEAGPTAQPIAPTGVSADQAGPLAQLAGIPLGSRVLLHLSSAQSSEKAFAVVDLIESAAIPTA